MRWRLGLGVALALAVLVVGLTMGRQADWRVLYANLPDKEGGTIIAQLAQMNIPYKYTEGGGAILVPAERVHDTRLRLASQGLPKGSVHGFESMEANNRFGMTQFQERLAFQRGLEGELTRSIQSIGSVQSARVHLALPNQNGFFRDQQKPSASVLVSLYPGRALDRNQLAGIVHLVAASVPELKTEAVSVLDDTGKLLSKPAESAGAGGGVDAQQLHYVQQIEQSYTRRILEILEPVVGRNNVKAQVTAEIDFNQVEQTSEQHRPNQTPDASAVRSQQLVESINGSGAGLPPTGVPGATSNQPPAQTTAPINAQGQPATPGQALGPGVGNTGNAGGAGGAAGSSKRESIINYEVDKTVKVVRGSAGAIKRLSAAVVLNNQTVTDDKGRTTVAPIPDQQLQRMTALVREAIGINPERGDSVNLMSASFAKETSEAPDVPLWKQPEVQEMARSLAWPLVMLGGLVMILMMLVRPALKKLSEPRRAPVQAVVAEELDRPQLPPPKKEEQGPTPQEQALEDARKLTRDNPQAVASIVRGWINGEIPG